MKECLILANNEKSLWYQDLDFRTGFLLSKSRSFKKSGQRPELSQIIAATHVPEFHTELTHDQRVLLFIGSQQHVTSDWILLYSTLETQPEDMAKGLTKNFQSLGVEKVKILSDGPDATKMETGLFASLKSRFPATELVYWSH